jgi:drug/metabolite transporter (DMT)-like permease
MIGTGVTGTILSWPALTKSQMPSLQTVGLLILASILNGLGVWAYSIKSTDLAIRTSGFIITVSITMIMISAIVGFILLNENINGRYVLAIFTGILTVYLMNS